MTNWELWHQLGTPTRRAIRRSKTRWGHPYTYRPRGNLLDRLSRENGLSKEVVYQRLMELHNHFKSGQL